MANEDEEEQRQHQVELRRTYLKRRRLLEIRKARQGDDAPPQLDLDLQEIDEAVAKIDATLAAYSMAAVPKPTPEAIAHVRNRFDDELDFLIAQFASITDRQTRTEERQARTEGQVTDVAASLAQWVKLSEEWRSETGEHLRAIIQGQIEETAKREWGQQRNFWLSIIAIVLPPLIIAGLLLWVLK